METERERERKREQPCVEVSLLGCMLLVDVRFVLVPRVLRGCFFCVA